MKKALFKVGFARLVSSLFCHDERIGKNKYADGELPILHLKARGLKPWTRNLGPLKTPKLLDVGKRISLPTNRVYKFHKQ